MNTIDPLINITAVTPGLNEPSSRFRVRQYIPVLMEHNILVSEFWSTPPLSYKLPGLLGKIRQRYVFPLSGSVELIKLLSLTPSLINCRRSDLVWMNRPSHNVIRLDKLYGKPVIFDVDDAIWLNDKRKIGRIAETAAVVFAGNSYIANWFDKFNQNIFIIPTAVDTERFKPGLNISNDTFNIVWTGTSQTSHYLSLVEKALYLFFQKYSDSRLIIISDVQPKFNSKFENKIIFYKWNPEIESTALQKAHIGIMPLFDTEWEKGKCSLKMMQYMSTELPVIVSPVGMNVEILNQGDIGFSARNTEEWFDTLEVLYKNRDQCNILGKNGRRIITERYSSKIVAVNIAKSMKSNL